MPKHLDIKKIERVFLTLQLSGIFLLLFLAFFFQIILHELPCPLCILQRIGFIATAVGFLMNLRFGLRPSHYAMALCSALFTSFVALRQIALHVIPGSGAYGSPFFGLHLYTWSFIVAMMIVIVTTVMMGIDSQYENTNSSNGNSRGWMMHIFFGIASLLIVANIISILLECGISECPDIPCII
jgi:disulfide bond formation protein DsbB